MLADRHLFIVNWPKLDCVVGGIKLIPTYMKMAASISYPEEEKYRAQKGHVCIFGMIVWVLKKNSKIKIPTNLIIVKWFLVSCTTRFVFDMRRGSICYQLVFQTIVRLFQYIIILLKQFKQSLLIS